MRVSQPLLLLLFASSLPLACGTSENPEAQSQPVQPDVRSAQQAPIEADQAAVQAVADEFAEEFANELAASIQASFDEHQRIFELGGTPEEIAAQRALFLGADSMTAEQAREAWMAPANLKGASVAEVLTTLAATTGLGMDTSPLAAHLESPCTVDPEGLTAVQMFEETCRSIGFTPVYPDGNPFRQEDLLITFEEGERQEPAVYVGPFLLRVSEVHEHAPYAAGEVHLEGIAMGLPAGMLSASQTMSEWFRVHTVVDSKQNNLRMHEDRTTLTQPNLCHGLLRIRTSEDLAQMLQSVESIASIEGQISIQIPTQVHEIAFDAQNQGPQTVAGYEVKLKKLGEQCELTVAGDNPDRLMVTWCPMYDAKTPMGIQHHSAYAFNGTLEANLSVPETPQTLHVKLMESQSFSFPFELVETPLERFAQQPEAVTELAYQGEAPVTFEFVAFQKRDTDFPKVTMTTHNHTNKDIKNLQCKFLYTDALDNELKNSYSTLQATEFSMDPKPMVAAGESHTADQAAFFMPKETTTVRFQLHGIEFMDGTTWEPQP